MVFRVLFCAVLSLITMILYALLLEAFLKESAKAG